MPPKLIAVIESKLRVEWSPEQISGWILTDQEQLISHESIYLTIWAKRGSETIGVLWTSSDDVEPTFQVDELWLMRENGKARKSGLEV